MTKTTTAVVITSICSAALGFTGGYFWAKKKLTDQFESDLEQEIQETKHFYKNLSNAPDYEDPSEMVDAVIPKDEADRLKQAVAVTRVYQGAATQEEADKTLANIFQRHVEVPEDVVEIPAAGVPRVVPEEQFLLNTDDYEQLNWTYFVLDDVVTDEHDEIVENAEDLVGEDLGGKFRELGPEHNLLHIQNDQLKTQFEIARGQSYAKEVAGLGDE